MMEVLLDDSLLIFLEIDSMGHSLMVSLLVIKTEKLSCVSMALINISKEQQILQPHIHSLCHPGSDQTLLADYVA